MCAFSAKILRADVKVEFCCKVAVLVDKLCWPTVVDAVARMIQDIFSVIQFLQNYMKISLF